jgi:uncharacterized protein YcbX
VPTLARITIFPIKSLDGVALQEAEMTAGGGLRNDRRWAILDAGGAFINGKRNPAVHLLRAEFGLAEEMVRLKTQGQQHTATFHLRDDSSRLAAWLSGIFHTTVTVVEDDAGGFPDDLAAPGPTVISTQSLQEVSRWFELPLEEVRRRFRANLEIDADAPFWEDQLFASQAQGVAFQIGAVSFLGTNPCARCVVPGRSADAGQPTPRFQKTFAERRQASLPAWAAPERFDHFYRLAVNTRVVSPAAGALRVGDAVRILASNHGAIP